MKAIIVLMLFFILAGCSVDPALELRNFECVGFPDGYNFPPWAEVRVQGEIENISGIILGSLVANIELVSEEGEIVATAFGMVQPSGLMPDERGSFDASAVHSPAIGNVKSEENPLLLQARTCQVRFKDFFSDAEWLSQGLTADKDVDWHP